MVAIEAVRHLGIVVSNMEESLVFYRDKLGLAVVKVMYESGEYIDKLLSLHGAEVKTVKMSVGSGPTLIELLEFKSHSEEEPRTCEVYSVGVSHLAFSVEDVDSQYRELQEAGVAFNGPPQTSPDGYAKVAFCRDPDGSLIELVEVLED